MNIDYRRQLFQFGLVALLACTGPDARSEYADAVLADSPLVYYQFEETDLTEVVNAGSLGAAANGTYSETGIVLAEPSATDDLGGGIFLDGVDSFVGIPGLEHEPLTDLTLELWLNRSTDWPGLTALFAHEAWAPGAVHFNLVASDPHPLVEFAINGNPSFPRFTPDWPPLEWHHLVITYESEAAPPRVSLYLNGALFSQTELTDARTAVLAAARLGVWNNSRRFEGHFDEFALYGSALTAERIEAHFHEVHPEVILTVEPSDVTVLRGEAAAFRVGATGLDRTYQWYRDGEAIAGATGVEYMIPAATSDDDGALFSAVVGNESGSETTVEALLTVISEVSLLEAPGDQYALVGQPATFPVAAQGPDLEYQWFRDGEEIPGATESTYITDATTSADDGALFSVRVRNDVNSVVSEAALLTVVQLPEDAYGQAVVEDAPLVYYRFSETDGVAAQNIGTLGSSARGTYSDLGVTTGQISAFEDLGDSIWLDGAEGHVAIPPLSETLTRLTIEMWINRTYDWPGLTAIVANDAWRRMALHFNLVEAEGGPMIEFAVNGNPSAPRFHPEWDLEEWHYLVVTYDTETEPGTYRLYLDGVMRSEASIPGSTPVRLTGAQIGKWQDARQFEGYIDEFAIHADVLTPERIEARYLTVQTGVNIAIPPASATVLRGDPVTFSVVATGNDLVFQWFLNGEAIPGADQAEYTIDAVTPDQDGAVLTVEVGNETTTELSAEATLTVISAVSIVSAPSDVAVQDGELATFEVVVSGPNPEYQWFRDGEAIEGATSETYSLTATVADHGARFNVEVGNDVGSVTSGEALLSVFGEPAIDYASAVLEGDPLIYYRFEEDSGAVTSVNQGQLAEFGDGTYPGSGVILGGPSASSELGRAAEFATGFVEVPDLAQPDFGQLTVEMWLNRFENASGITALLANDGWASGLLHLNLIASDDYPLLEFAVNGNPAPYPRFTPAWELNEWNHLVVTYDTESVPPAVRLYLNGEPHSMATLANANPIVFTGGRIAMWGTSRPLRGMIDEFALYDRALSHAQILRNYVAARVVDAPEDVILQLTRTSETELEFSWDGSGYRLESAPAVTASPTWSDVAGGDTSPVSVPVSPDEDGQFFRLRKID